MLTQLRHQGLSFWRSQSLGQRAAILALIVAAVVLSIIFITWANSPTYAVAFSGLSEADAGRIVELLDEEGTPYQLRGAGTILVPNDKVHEVRLTMARQGLPQGDTVGFELFSGSTLGMTEFSQRVNYRRALEGELERTIGSMTSVEAVRVHIVTPEHRLLAGDQPPATASVTIMPRAGASLDAGTVRAITHLVASSVEGLRPENVVLVDVRGNLLAAGSAGEEDGGLDTQTDERLAAELAYAAEIESKVRGLLDKVLGPNRSVVKASIAMDWTEREKATQSYDPAQSVVRSSQAITERYGETDAEAGGVPGAETNLPPALPTETASGNFGGYLRTEEIVNYEITQTESRETIPAGQIKRVSLSVLIDGVTDPEQLKTLQTAIVAAAGIDETRGDTIAVDSLSFDRSYYEDQAQELDELKKTDLYVRIGIIAAAFVLLAALLWYIQRLLSNLRLASAEAWTPIMKPASELALASPPASKDLGEQDNEQEDAMEEHAAIMRKATARQMAQPASEADREVERLAQEVASIDPANVAKIIHLWLSEDTS